MNLEIKSATIVWYSKIVSEANTEFLEISKTVIYPKLVRGSIFLAFEVKKIDYLDDAYNNELSSQEFLELFENALLIDGALLGKGEGFRIRVQRKYKWHDFNKLLLSNKLDTFSSFCKKKFLFTNKDFNKFTGGGIDFFKMIYVCKHCGMPEDESDFVWGFLDDNEWWVRLWIHNDGNMWIAHFAY